MPYGDDNNDIYSNDDYEDVASTSNEMTEGNEQVIHRLPTFTSVGETMLVNEGSTIRLPCIVNRLGKKLKKCIEHNVGKFNQKVSFFRLVLSELDHLT